MKGLDRDTPSSSAIDPDGSLRGSALGILYGSGASLVLLGLVTGLFVDGNATLLSAVVVAAYAVCVPIALLRDRLPRWFHPTAVAVGSVLIAAASGAAGDARGSAVVGIFLTYVSGYSFFFFHRRMASAQVVWGAIAYAGALVFADVDQWLAQWAIVVGAAAIAGALVGGLGAAARRSAAVERDASAQLREVDAMKTTFLHAMGHELQNPIASVKGFADALRRYDDRLTPQDRDDLLDRLTASAERLDRTVQELLDLGRLRAGIVEPHLTEVELLEVVERAIVMSALPDGRVHVTGDRAVLHIDAVKIEHAIANLLVNAGKYTPGDRAIEVMVHRNETTVDLDVLDRGPGIPDGIKDTIFEAFVRADGVVPDGSGIGLSLVRQFARLHGGDAWVEDRDGGGARFRIRLPASAS